MRTTKITESIAVELDTTRAYCIGQLIDEGDTLDLQNVEEKNAKDVIDKIIPKRTPTIELLINRNLLIKLLADLADDDWLNVKLYDNKSPIVFTGAESFGVIMPGRLDSGDNILDIRKAAGL